MWGRFEGRRQSMDAGNTGQCTSRSGRCSPTFCVCTGWNTGVRFVIDGVGGKCYAGFERRGKQRTWPELQLTRPRPACGSATGTRGTSSSLSYNRTIGQRTHVFSEWLEPEPSQTRRRLFFFLPDFKVELLSSIRRSIHHVYSRSEPFFRVMYNTLPHQNRKIWFQTPGNSVMDQLTHSGREPSAAFLVINTFPV